MHWNEQEEADRRRWQDPERLLTAIGLSHGEIFADIGSGNGFFSLPAARMVGPGGRVFAVDTDHAAIHDLDRRMRAEGLTNIRPSTDPAEEALYCRGCVDVVFFGIVLHDFDNPARVIRQARTMIHREGRLINLDWKVRPMPIGPPIDKRFSEAKAAWLLSENGFEVWDVRDWGPYHYLIAASPSQSWV
jgi:ubiquinone/menaquinone biosynthesis C-methylase UbiE